MATKYGTFLCFIEHFFFSKKLRLRNFFEKYSPYNKQMRAANNRLIKNYAQTAL